MTKNIFPSFVWLFPLIYLGGRSGFPGDWRFGLNLLGILSFENWRFGDFEKKMGMGILPFRVWGFDDLHVQTLEIWGFNDVCVDGDLM